MWHCHITMWRLSDCLWHYIWYIVANEVSSITHSCTTGRTLWNCYITMWHLSICLCDTNCSKNSPQTKIWVIMLLCDSVTLFCLLYNNRQASHSYVTTLTLAITFEQYAVARSYFTCVFLVTRPFSWYGNFWPCDLDLELWPTFQNFKIFHNFSTVRDRALIFHICIPCDKTFHLVPPFLLCDLDIYLDPLAKTFTDWWLLFTNLPLPASYIVFWQLLFHCKMTFQLVPKCSTSWPWLIYCCYLQIVAASYVFFLTTLVTLRQSSRKAGGLKTQASEILAGPLKMSQILVTLWRK